MIRPHGGRLVNRVVDKEHAEQIRDEIVKNPLLDLNEGLYQDLINIANGRYSPIEGFMDKSDLLKVVKDMTLEDGTTWPLPIILDVSPDLASRVTLDEWVGLRGPDGKTVGAIKPREVYECDKERAAAGVFGTTNPDHPGVNRFNHREPFFIGGKVAVFDEIRYNDIDLLPKETRVLFEDHGWDTVVGFQTRNAPHRAHEYIQKSALEHVDGLLIQPKLGSKKRGDFTDETIIDAYETLIDEYYPNGCTSLTVFPSKMNYAGPREAVFDSIIRKNQGCSHFIVGRDHAGVGDYYDGYASQRIFDQIDHIGIEPMFYNYSFYCERCDGMTSEKLCPHDEDDQIHPSGTEIRELLKAKTMPSEKMIRAEVAQSVMHRDRPFVTSTAGGAE